MLTSQESFERRSWSKIIGLLAVCIFVFLGVGYIVMGQKKSDAYQAVFLSNGQVYFGKKVFGSWRTLDLTDVYYLQVNTTATSSKGVDDLALIKLGNELHGPEDGININWNHVLFVEHLRNDSRVVRAIKTYRAK